MTLSIVVCIAAFFVLLWILRRDTISLGLPIAYLFSLLLIHVPGALAHMVGGGLSSNREPTAIAIGFTAIASVCFVAGVWWARFRAPAASGSFTVDRSRFCRFCLVGGWLVTYGLGPLYRIPSVAATLDRGAGIWMLAVMIGLRAALQRTDLRRVGIWLCAMMVYPVLMLLFGGFLSYGSAAVIVVCSALAISTRSHTRVVAGICIASFVGLSVFVVYFQHRDAIRDQVWGGAPLEARVDSVMDMIRDLSWFDINNSRHLMALDERLNQNYFAGLAAIRIEQGQVDYLRGRSVWEGFLALVPRIIWPEKPVFGGSPKIVAEMTGLQLATGSSFGVGNVMEFQINFGIPGLIVGFSLLGWLIGKLDRKAAVAEAQGDLGKLILFFLPCVALIQPNGSIVEITGGPAAALVAAFGWKWAWNHWSATLANRARRARHARAPAPGAAAPRWYATHRPVSPRRP